MQGIRTLAQLLARSPPARAYKGGAGKVGIIGGSNVYSGAPYFAGLAALRCGADLAWVLTTKSAASAIKGYSPELMVQPIIPETTNESLPCQAVELSIVKELVGRMSVLVLGPGLGRAAPAMAFAKDALAAAAEAGVPTVVDADGLWLLHSEPEAVAAFGTSCAPLVLTPNAMELHRLRLATAGRASPETTVLTPGTESASEVDAAVRSIQAALGCPSNLTALCKGAADVLVLPNAESQRGPAPLATPAAAAAGEQSASPLPASLVVESGGSPRRCGGQGDLLAGALAAALCWAGQQAACEAAAEALYGSSDHAAVRGVKVGAACLAASELVRHAAAAAFKAKGRSMLASDVLEQLPTSVRTLWDTPLEE